MTKAKKQVAAEPLAQTIVLRPGETAEQRAAEMTIGTTARSAFLHHVLCGTLFGGGGSNPDVRAPFEVMQAELTKRQEAAASGDLRAASDLLITQAHVLDAVFGDFMHRGLQNAGRLDVVQRYMGLALKAQAQSRATIEALARMHQPREQVVRHVHVHEGGQAVVTDELHMHGRGVSHEQRDDQSQAAGAEDTGGCAALPCPHTIGATLPISSGEREAKVPNARRHKFRRTPR